MCNNNARMTAIKAINDYTPNPPFDYQNDPSINLFGKHVFSLQVMKQRLPKEVFKSVSDTIANGTRMDASVADIVASAMKYWAIEHGASHYAHVFFPLTGLTAEKHDSFLVPDVSGNALAEFSGQTLIQGEPDASSFPNGGLRETFEARGYTAWDVTSPAYIMESDNGATLCIPTAFISWTGEALDKKTPILRSMQALNKQAHRILKLFGTDSDAFISSTCGAEQEYFLVDKGFASARPDLIAAGRSLFGAPAPKGQQFDDHYFGAIPERVLSFMFQVERELYKLGIPVKTRHNEVAPGQFEIAPVFENSNIATDHQQLIMVTLKKVAEKYGMRCLLHEKPFAGINGSGKHVNFSMGNAVQGNLLDPGETPHKNAQFLVFCAAVIRAVHKNAKLLRAVVATAGNDHRLGANEAPPAIISIFLGDELTDVFEQIQNGGAKSSKGKGTLNIGVDSIPPLPKDAGDRNRTSPFAFTCNRFEFRAVGSDQSIAGPLVALNTIVADSLDYIATEIEAKVVGNPDNLNAAIQEVISAIMKEHGDIVFNGDGYADAWQAEAARRGLPNLKTAPEALPEMISKDVVELFEKHQVLTEVELHSRMEIYLEQYIMKVAVEARVSIDMARTMIYPAALTYQSLLADNCLKLRELGLPCDEDTLKILLDLSTDLKERTDRLESLLAYESDDSRAKAVYYCESILPAMLAIRKTVDQLEKLVPDHLWQLPTYQEMLFYK